MTDKAALDRLSERFDALGANLSHWPADLAESARALLARSEEARALHRSALRLDDLVERAAMSEVSNGLAFRIVGEVASRRSDKLSWLTGSPGRFGLAGVSFCGVALALGVALGSMTTPAMSASSLDLGASFDVSFADGGL